MKRTTISLPDEVAVLLEREAHRQRTSISEITRQALVKYLGLGSDQPRHIPFAALGNSGHPDTARNIEQILSEEWGRARDR
jgi:hypothetical protein